jgi:hypothetical protein
MCVIGLPMTASYQAKFKVLDAVLAVVLRRWAWPKVLMMYS